MKCLSKTQNYSNLAEHEVTLNERGMIARVMLSVQNLIADHIVSSSTSRVNSIRRGERRPSDDRNWLDLKLLQNGIYLLLLLFVSGVEKGDYPTTILALNFDGKGIYMAVILSSIN